MHNRQLAKNLKKVGINVIHPDIPSGKISQMILLYIFLAIPCLYEAKKNAKKDCHFVTAKNIRNVSSNMIY